MPGAELHQLQSAGELIIAPRGWWLLALALTAGCYTYRPLSAPEPAAGTRLQAMLTDIGADSLASRIGPGIGAVAGDLLAADSASLTLAVRAVENRRRERNEWDGEPLVIPRRFIRELQQRHISFGGTGLLGGALAAGLVAATQAFGGGGSVEGGGNGTGGSGGR